jgi:hypothetical protein
VAQERGKIQQTRHRIDACPVPTQQRANGERMAGNASGAAPHRAEPPVAAREAVNAWLIVLAPTGVRVRLLNENAVDSAGISPNRDSS